MDDIQAIIRKSVTPMTPLDPGVEAELGRLEPFSAILFDVYGTLLISGVGEVGVHVETEPPALADPALLARHGIDLTPATLHERLQQAIAAAHQRANRRGIDYPEVDILQIWRSITGMTDTSALSRFALAYELAVHPVDVMPGATQLVATCKAERIRVGIISNAQFYTPLLLDWFFGQNAQVGVFDDKLCFFSYREGRAKPSTHMFRRAAENLMTMGVDVQKTLYVGNDMLNDILPARSIGFATALFAGDRRSLRMRLADDRVRGIVPDLIVTDLCQLIPTMNRHRP